MRHVPSAERRPPQLLADLLAPRAPAVPRDDQDRLEERACEAVNHGRGIVSRGSDGAVRTDTSGDRGMIVGVGESATGRRGQGVELVMKAVVSGVVVALASEAARRSSLVGAIILSLPLTSIL